MWLSSQRLTHWSVFHSADFFTFLLTWFSIIFTFLTLILDAAPKFSLNWRSKLQIVLFATSRRQYFFFIKPYFSGFSFRDTFTRNFAEVDLQFLRKLLRQSLIQCKLFNFFGDNWGHVFWSNTLKISLFSRTPFFGGFLYLLYNLIVPVMKCIKWYIEYRIANNWVQYVILVF